MAKISILMCLIVCSNALAQDYSAFEKNTFITAEDTLPYRLLKPDSLHPDLTYPLVLFLHGAGERGTDNEINVKYIGDLFLKPDTRANYPGYVVVPQCPTEEEWTPDDWFSKPSPPLATVVKLIDSLTHALPIDGSRIYVIGLSMGGYGTWYLITRYPDKFAAAVPICGGGDWNQASAIRHVPLWVFHGRKDTIVSPEQSRRMVKALKKAGGNPRYTEFKKVGHESWTPAFNEPELLRWLYRQQLIR